MTMLKEYKRHFFGKKLQLILLDKKWGIVESDDKLFLAPAGTSIVDIHPFFESFPPLLESDRRTFKFFCIHLPMGEDHYVADIVLVIEEQGMALLIHDLTEHYEAYQSVAQARNESIIKTELTVIKNKELEERERFKNAFIQNFSHEIRNPLTSIMAIANILSDTDLTNEQQRMLEFLMESNAALALLLEDVLSIGAIDSGRLILREKQFSIVKLFKLLEFTYRTKAKQKGVELVPYFDDRIPEYVQGDRLRLYQILTNLLDNALKYTDEGSVSFSMSFNQKWANKVSIRFEVSDTGIGIPEESIERIFESFSQLGEANKKEGSGLGLAIVKGIITLMGSEIKVKSEIDRGSVFYFDLLLKYPLHPNEEAEKESTDAFISNFARKDKDELNLLVVEDDERIQTVILKTLIDADFFNVEILSDGTDVLKELVNKQYDLILMDVDLPSITGDHLTRLIREFPFKNIKDIPIIGLTANAYSEQLDSYLASGMNDVLTKPFEKKTLITTVLRFLR